MSIKTNDNIHISSLHSLWVVLPQLILADIAPPAVVFIMAVQEIRPKEDGSPGNKRSGHAEYFFFIVPVFFFSVIMMGKKTFHREKASARNAENKYTLFDLHITVQVACFLLIQLKVE